MRNKESRRSVPLTLWAIAATLSLFSVAGTDGDGDRSAPPAPAANAEPPAAPEGQPGSRGPTSGTPQTQPPPPPVPNSVKGGAFNQSSAAGDALGRLKADPMNLQNRVAYQSQVNGLSAVNRVLNKAAKEFKWDPKDVRATQTVMGALSQGGGGVPAKGNSDENASSLTQESASETYKTPTSATLPRPQESFTTEKTETAPEAGKTLTLASETPSNAPQSATQIALAQVQNNPILAKLMQATIDKPADVAANTSPENTGELKATRTSQAAQAVPAKELSATEKFQSFLAELFMPEFIDALSRASVATEAAPDSTATKNALPNPGDETSEKDKGAAIAGKKSLAGTSSSTPWDSFTRKSNNIILGSAERLSQNFGRGVDRFALVLGLAARISAEKTRRGIASEDSLPTDSEARSDFSTSPSSHAAVDLAVAGIGLGGSVGFILLGLRRLFKSSRHGKRAKKRSKK